MLVLLLIEVCPPFKKGRICYQESVVCIYNGLYSLLLVNQEKQVLVSEGIDPPRDFRKLTCLFEAHEAQVYHRYISC